jgi:uncharacterized membrane protein (UPF0127 family)
MKAIGFTVLSLLFSFGIAGVFSGCGSPEEAATPAPTPVPTAISRATIRAKGYELSVELANTPRIAQRGLMDRKSLGEYEGMLFIFARPREQEFWMANTYLPLSIAFLEDDGTILNIEDMKPLDTGPRYRSAKACRLALEVNQGWFARHDIRPGDRIEIPGEVTQGVFQDAK